jgi:hypothetical protein
VLILGARFDTLAEQALPAEDDDDSAATAR